MTDVEIETRTAPINDALPCGPDLDAEDDDAFLNFMSASEMSLPDQYFVEDHEGTRKPFFTEERFKDVNLDVSIASANQFLKRTHDLRLLCLLAKIQIFNRKPIDFQQTLETIATLLERYWEELHPGAASGLRAGILERLNEHYTVVTALNNAPLFRSRRFGAVSWQSYQAAVREAGGNREGADTSSIDRVMIDECKVDASPIMATQAVFGSLAGAIARIDAACAKLSSGPPSLQHLTAAVTRIRGLLDRINPTVEAEGMALVATGPGEEPHAVGDATTFETTAHAAQALAAAAHYIGATEPSSPALLLLRQAQALVGMSFLDTLAALLPEHVGRATVNVAALPIFSLPLTQLDEKGRSSDAAQAFEDGREDDAEAPGPLSRPPRIGSRAEALVLLDRVGSYYRAVEPSSPIPLLIQAARDFAGKDFLSIIRTMLPEGVLRGE